ncbi:type I CRISPR-associated protein Cas7 [Porphyromonas cangingivalis]|uniref:CRISPR-associated protein Csd2 n=1 Tax=Porphyromonas cangingivalis TaxID=36874 RepID=A0A1T4LZB5_PORCN|nr:type I CRISPR-associated protein Cas7 [Porphyromonas cangingivalis]SJZ60079.1 CRISPR-associated protein Csd2 [Porphyromonas cangingivalis]SPY35370.1 Uncharacterized protein predicted to be involved in DNA repair [Porphyromonas cangingivalis]VEJ03859.1 Uncharacterized protein predicted to be involved in DNA repair [Porphyromonas cangingivalis]
MEKQAIQNRYDFIILYDVVNGNPNGDPDAGNMPRTDAQTDHGIVSPPCLKRKIRNYVDMISPYFPEYANIFGKVLDPDLFRIYIRDKVVLNQVHGAMFDEVVEELKLSSEKKQDECILKTQQAMCKHYYDVRTFGAVMSTSDDETNTEGVDEETSKKKKSGTKGKGKTDKQAGQVRGPVQLTFSKSIDPVSIEYRSVARIAVTNSKDQAKESTFGSLYEIPYALYKGYGFVSAMLAEKTGFDEADLKLLWHALLNMFEHDRAAARGLMSMRKIIVFKHNTRFGNAPAHSLFDRVKIKLKDSVEYPRSFEDYEISIDEENLPQGVEIIDPQNLFQ